MAVGLSLALRAWPGLGGHDFRAFEVRALNWSLQLCERVPGSHNLQATSQLVFISLP